MIENSTITVNQLSTLNFNSAQISTCKNCSKITYNIDGTLNFNNTPFIMSPNSILNISSTGVVNINNADGLCINQGGQINIATGGKIYINGQDYTNIFVNGYNNIYDKSFVNQPILGGTYYAFNRIETSGTVNTLTNQTTELIAGRQIVFKPGFTGYAGLHASIDSKVNNCIETPCGSGMRMANTTYNNANSVGVYDKTNNHFILFPNPNNGQFTLKLGNTNSNNLVEIYDVMGKKIWSKVVLTNKELIDISDQPKGIYLVKVLKGNNLFTQKIIYH